MRFGRFWSFLLAEQSNLRILVSGRSPVGNLTLAGRKAKSLDLQGFITRGYEGVAASGRH